MKASLLLTLALIISTLSPLVSADEFESMRIENYAKSTKLAKAWDRTQAATYDDDERKIAAEKLLAFWDAQLNLTYQRGLKQYPKTAKQYQAAQRAWLAYRESCLSLARELSTNRKKSFVSKSWGSSEETSLLAMLTMCRVSELLTIEVSRSYFSGKKCMGTFSLSDELPTDNQSDKLLSYILSSYADAVSTADMLNASHREYQYYDSRLELISALIVAALPKTKEGESTLVDDVLTKAKAYHQLDEASVDGEFVDGMMGSMHTMLDAADGVEQVKVLYRLFSSLLYNTPLQFRSGVAPRG